MPPTRIFGVVKSSERLLRTPRGVSLLHYLHATKAAIGLPEVVEMELHPVLADDVLKKAEEIRSGLLLLKSIIRRSSTCSLPDEAAV